MSGRNTNHITYEQFVEMTAEQMDAVPLDQLCGLQDEIAFREQDVKDGKKALVAAILRRCEDAGRTKLRQDGKDTGSVTLPSDDPDYKFKFDIPKKVEWDQGILRNVVEELASTGENIEEYVTINITVSEAKYNAWPSGIKHKFRDARMVKDGTVKAEIVEAKKKLTR